MKSTHGGRRPGAGKPKGHRAPQTLAKLEAREFARQLITAKLQPLIDAQIEHAIGIQHFFLRDETTQQFIRITNPKEIERALNQKSKHYWIFTKDPSVQAFTDLMNRALDKPAEQVEVDVTVHTDQITARLLAGRERLAQEIETQTRKPN